MDTLRTILTWLATVLLWSVPFIARRRGKQFWQSGMFWKYPLYVLGIILLQVILIFMFGALIGVFGNDPGFDVLYAGLAAFAISEIIVVGWLIFRKQ